MGQLLRKPATWIVIGVLAVGGGAAGLYWFTPWKLFTDKQVNDSVPAVAVPDSTGEDAPADTANRLLAEGTLVDQEHATSGSVQIIELDDGRRQLILRELRTSDGPDLRVWLTDQRVVEDAAGWRIFDDGKYTEVGRLKGNQGNQVYDLPPDLDITEYHSVTIWCKRFAISFGAASLAAA